VAQWLARETTQVGFKGCTLTGFTVDLDESLVLLYNAIDCSQPQSRALSNRLCSEERFEEVINDLFAHSRTVVAHSYIDALK